MIRIRRLYVVVKLE